MKIDEKVLRVVTVVGEEERTGLDELTKVLRENPEGNTVVLFDELRMSLQFFNELCDRVKSFSKEVDEHQGFLAMVGDRLILSDRMCGSGITIFPTLEQAVSAVESSIFQQDDGD